MTESEERGLALRVLQEVFNQLSHVSKDRQKNYTFFLSSFSVTNGKTREMVDMIKPDVGQGRVRHKILKDTAADDQSEIIEFQNINSVQVDKIGDAYDIFNVVQ